MIFSLFVTLFVLNCFILILLILVQRGKGSMGLGNLGGGTQLLFGGSGGQDLFQKITWILGALFMFGSLALAIMKTQQHSGSHYLEQYQPVQQQPAQPMPQPQ